MSQYSGGPTRPGNKPWRKGGGQKANSQKKPDKRAKPCINPIFESWILEWQEEAEAKGSKMQYVYRKALQSLRKYPLSLSSGKECSILESFGPHMCKMIDSRMAKENIPSQNANADSNGVLDIVDLTEEEPGPSKKARVDPTVATKSDSVLDVIETNVNDVVVAVDLSKNHAKPKSKRKYLPAYRSGPYAVLVALIKNENKPDFRGYMTKTQLQRDAQNYCNASLTKSDSTKSTYYSAWSSIKTLEIKELILRRGNPAQICLTPEGRELATALLKESKNPRSQSPSSDLNDDETEQVEAVDLYINNAEVKFEPGQFEIVLYVDTCETNGKTKPQEVLNELQENGVTLYIRRLSVGDFIWVCREVTNVASKRLTMSPGREFILPYVVERKRTDDFASSIRDGRFHEQKYRLMQTNLKPIYLIESYGKGDWGLAEGALGQALCNTQITNDFHVQEVASIKETCNYLTFMTRHLKKLYENKSIIGCTKKNLRAMEMIATEKEVHLMSFSEFNDSSFKKTNWKVKEMFARHLMRMKGVSVDKAYAIVQRYPTLHDLHTAYSECETPLQKEKLLQPILFGNSGRKIGPAISRKICRYYNLRALF